METLLWLLLLFLLYVSCVKGGKLVQVVCLIAARVVGSIPNAHRVPAHILEQNAVPHVAAISK